MHTAGRFYIVQLMPEEAPHVFKFGFSTRLEKRIWEHRTTCPTAKVIQSWPCLAKMEKVAIDYILRGIPGRRYSGEVFACEDFSAMFKRADAFFANHANAVIYLPPTISEEAIARMRITTPKARTKPRKWLDREDIAAILDITSLDAQHMMVGTYRGYHLKGCITAMMGHTYTHKAPIAEVARVKAEMDAKREQAS